MSVVINMKINKFVINFQIFLNPLGQMLDFGTEVQKHSFDYF